MFLNFLFKPENALSITIMIMIRIGIMIIIQ